MVAYALSDTFPSVSVTLNDKLCVYVTGSPSGVDSAILGFSIVKEGLLLSTGAGKGSPDS